MKKIIVLAAMLALSASANSSESQVPGIYFFDVVFYRPAGFILTVAGTALFIGISPLTAFASIAPPHDAFPKTAGALIGAPATFTFERPLGVVNPDSDGVYRR